MSGRACCCYPILLTLCAAAGAQTAPPTTPTPASSNAPEMTSRDAPATFTSRVNLVMVPVVVTGPGGRPVDNLTKDDFQLFDKGKPQVITRFSIEKAGTSTIPAIRATNEAAPDQTQPAPPPIPERFIAYVFDDLHLNIGDLAQIRAAADQHFAQSLDAVTRAAIFTTSGHTTLDFTDDRQKLHDTLQRIFPQSMENAAPNSDCPAISYYMADMIQNKFDQLALNAATSEAMACLGLSASQSGSQAAAQAAAQASAAHALGIGDGETHFSLAVLTDVVRRLSAAPGSRVLILASPGFYLLDTHRPEETDLMDRAIRANVTINSLDARGLYTGMADLSQSGPASLAMSNIAAQYQKASDSANSDVLAELAYGTGGKFFQNDNGLREGLNDLAKRPELIYLLGFSPQNLKLDGAYHALKVTLRNPGNLKIGARRGYYAPRHLADPEEEAREDIREAVFSRDELREIPVDLNLQFFKASAIQARLTVLARVDVKSLHFRKAEGRNDDVLRIVSSVFDRNGNFVSGIEKTVEMKLKDETLERIPGSGIVIKTVMDVPPGTYAVRLVVRDSEGQAMAARNGSVVIP